MTVSPLRSLPWGVLALVTALALAQRPGPAAASATLIRSVEVVAVSMPERVLLGSSVYQATSSEILLPACEERSSNEPLPPLREGCPEATPGASACAVEGLGCTYPAGGFCRARFECVYGLWSPLSAECPEGEPWSMNPLSGSAECDAQRPVSDVPCESDGLVCGYVPCPLGEAPEFVATCRCGRWYLTQNSCAID
jgi:hypothetical protein